eukprot:5250639-Pleurochrysis_carterae.AAC.1
MGAKASGRECILARMHLAPFAPRCNLGAKAKLRRMQTSVTGGSARKWIVRRQQILQKGKEKLGANS